MRYFLVFVVLTAATPASAELIFFSEDRSMSVASHRFEGDRMVVTLRGGGEMTFDRSVITKIAPDEIPYRDETIAAADEGDVSITPSRALVQNTAYDPIIEQASDKHGVDARIIKAVIQVESAFQPRARSSKGAMGLMQLMPRTARQYKARNPYDPKSNIEAGVRYLRKLLDEFELPLALAAYNAGEGAVRRFGGIPPYAETRAYVSKVLGLLGGVSYQ
jgi:soluble lytic murein transglycosylase-like protein